MKHFLLLLLVGTASSARSQPVPGRAVAPAPIAGPGELHYDVEYPFMGYSQAASDNAIARLQAKLDRGELHLEPQGSSGYLSSLLKALGIDASSQVLVFSKSSMQVEYITAATPRAIYFNDDTYVGWVQGGLIEVATVDGRMGPVFYTLVNQAGAPAQFQREFQRCLLCHDTFALAGGGVPRFLFQSAYTRSNEEVLTDVVATETTDKTSLESRWGGWYVSGRQGGLVHLGNIFREPTGRPLKVVNVARGNLTSLTGLIDTTPYLTDKSDIVALLVIEHQIYLHDLISRANYKTRWLMVRSGAEGGSESKAAWADLSPQTQKMIQPMLEQLVQALLFVGAAPLSPGISSTSGFDTWFQSRGPTDRRGRSLRTLDLQTRLFRYPLSFLVYSIGFDNLPPGAKDYVFKRLAEVLTGRDQGDAFQQIPADQKGEMLDILTETKPEFARSIYLRR